MDELATFWSLKFYETVSISKYFTFNNFRSFHAVTLSSSFNPLLKHTFLTIALSGGSFETAGK